MYDLENLFNEETVEHISNLVEEKMPILKDISAFNKKDENLALKLEQLENSLSEDSKEKLNHLMKLIYQVDEYYFTLAYFLGIKCGKTIEKL